MSFNGSLKGSLRTFLNSAAAAPVLLVFSVLATSPAQAGDWSFNGRASDRLEVFDNFGLLPKSKGVVIRDSLSLTGDFAYTTHISKFDIIADIIANKYAGSGSKDLDDNILPKIATRYHQDGKTTSFDLGAQYAYVFIPSTEDFDPETGLIVEEDASARHSLSANFGLQHKIDRLNTVSYSSSASSNMYTGAGADNFSFNNSVSWSHVLTKRFSTSASLSARFLETDDAANTQQMVYSANAGISGRLTKRLSGNLGAGVSVVNSEKGDLLLPGAPRSSTTTVGYSANGGFQYSLKTLSLGGSVNYGLQPTTLGAVQNSLAFALNASKTINERSSISAFASAQFISSIDKNDGSKTISRFSFGPTYSYKLTKDWDLSAGYKFTLRDAVERAMAHNAFVTLAWKFGVK